MVIAAIFRIGVFVFAIYSPIPNEDQFLISPLLLQSGIDYDYFRLSAESLKQGISPIIENYRQFYSSPIELHGSGELGHLKGGLPVTPMMIIAMGYYEDNTLPLASIFLALSIILVWLWIHWLHKHGVPPLWLLLFALIPNPLWFMLNISSDLPFALLVSLFYMFYFAEERHRWYVFALLPILALAPLTRATGYSLICFVTIDILILRSLSPAHKLAAMTGCAFALAIYGVLRYPDFITVLTGHGGADTFTYFGLSHADYTRGIYTSLPTWLDMPLSWFSLLGSKLLYFTGLRPSYGSTSFWLVVARSSAGLVLLPGLIWVAWRGNNRDRLFIAALLMPILLGGTQDRYNLPIQPLLFYFGWKAYEPLWRRLVPWCRERLEARP